LNSLKKILISRIDSLGDVVLTLPAAGVLKGLYPDSRITFLGSSYTRPLIDASGYIDYFLDWNEIKNQSSSERLKKFKAVNADIIIHVFPRYQIARLASKAGIPVRLGTSRRIYHWLYCNRKVRMTRRGSDLHEAQLNLKLLVPLGAKENYTLSEIPDYYGLRNVEALNDELKDLLSTKRINLILHPKTKGSAREWGIDNFSRLVEILPDDAYKIFITGTAEDGAAIQAFLKRYAKRVVDLTGKLNLKELISFINEADGLVAASTGPLHIASALNKYALGLYAPMRPIHAGRWAPVGTRSDYMMIDKDCDDCRNSLECHCIKSIKPEEVFSRIRGALKK
jgi:ADP-heptose:LPS heptosyltransferase